MELPSLEQLERQVNRLLDKYKTVRNERDELADRMKNMEAEISELKRKNSDIEEQLEHARQNARNPEREELVREKVDELLAKLEGF